MGLFNSDYGFIYPLSNPIFWLLAILIPAFWFATLESSAPIPPGADMSKRQPQKTQGTYWLQPYLTNYPFIILAIIVYVFILGLQLLEGWWVLQLDWTVFWKLHQGPSPPGGWIVEFSYTFSEWIWVVFSLMNIIFGGMFVGIQVVSIAELVLFLTEGPWKERDVRSGGGQK